jgi:pimeloyl-ACP methyl ester carboxylesterase
MRPIQLYSTARIILLLLAGSLLLGCQAGSHAPDDKDIVFVVPGVGSPERVNGIARSVMRPGRTVKIIPWGAPLPLFFLNFSNQQIHAAIEKKLAGEVEAWHAAHPTGTIDLIGHSAGCGVVLGATEKLADAHVRNVVLVSPSVSKAYDLSPAIKHIDGKIHSFFSDRDSIFLRWRTSTFGSYDGQQTEAAGYKGFVNANLGEKLIEHPYDPAWKSLGNDGGHFSSVAEPFAKEIIRPLLAP